MNIINQQTNTVMEEYRGIRFGNIVSDGDIVMSSTSNKDSITMNNQRIQIKNGVVQIAGTKLDHVIINGEKMFPCARLQEFSNFFHDPKFQGLFQKYCGQNE